MYQSPWAGARYPVEVFGGNLNKAHLIALYRQYVQPTIVAKAKPAEVSKTEGELAYENVHREIDFFLKNHQLMPEKPLVKSLPPTQPDGATILPKALAAFQAGQISSEAVQTVEYLVNHRLPIPDVLLKSFDRQPLDGTESRAVILNQAVRAAKAGRLIDLDVSRIEMMLNRGETLPANVLAAING